MLTRWEDLPEQMQTESIRAYYNILINKKLSLWFKRLFDIIVSLIMIVTLSPVFLILAILIKMDSEGTVFYRQVRVTRGNRDFRIFKFRTMEQNAEKVGSLVTAGNDSRITRIGSKIRKCRLDEVPQLLNVLKGDMSFVGTRPEVRRYVDAYDDEMMATLLMPAGITSLASIQYKDEDAIMDKYMAEGKSTDEAYVQYVLPEKMRYNLEYIKQFSFWRDISLMLKTFISVIR